jgi:uncharacterized protein YkwD
LLFTAALALGCMVPMTSVGTSGGTVSSTQRSDADYRRIEAELMVELNAARANPPGYSAYLSQLLPGFSGNLLRRPGWPAPVQTQEGAAAVREGIDALKSQIPVPVLSLSSALSLAARDLALDQARTGGIGHNASDGSTPASRMARYGTWDVSYSENVDYGPVISGRDVLVDLIVDDGVRDRGHRRNIFDASARVAGISCGPHPKYGVMCVIDQAGRFTPK